MGLDVAVEIVGNEIVVALVDDGIAECCEAAGVAETPAFDGLEHLFQVRVEGEGAEVMSVAEVFDVFREVAEKENIRVADFAGDFNLQASSAIGCAKDGGMNERDTHSRHHKSQ